MGFKSIYALRIFELLVQVEKIGYRKMSVSELREWCGIGKGEYEFYKDFKRDAVNRAKTEINAKTDYEVDYKEIKESRKVVSLEWTIKHKTHFEKAQSEKAIILAKELRSTAAILEQLLEYGFTKQAANRLVKNHEEANIINAIKAVETYRSKHDVKLPLKKNGTQKSTKKMVDKAEKMIEFRYNYSIFFVSRRYQNDTDGRRN